MSFESVMIGNPELDTRASGYLHAFAVLLQIAVTPVAKAYLVASITASSTSIHLRCGLKACADRHLMWHDRIVRLHAKIFCTSWTLHSYRNPETLYAHNCMHCV